MRNSLPCIVLCLLLGACAGDNVRGSDSVAGPGHPAERRPLGKTLVYECSGYEFIARLGPAEMAVWLEDRYVILSRVHQAPGIRYEEGGIVFKISDGHSELQVDNRAYTDCTLAPRRAPWADARRRGVDFRAVGNEPGWYLEIQRGRQLLFVGDYGRQKVMLPDPGEEIAGATRSYEAINGVNRLRIEIVDQPCADTMSGDSYPSQVLVTLNGSTLSGCGLALDQPWE